MIQSIKTLLRERFIWGLVAVLIFVLALTSLMRHGWVTVVNLDSAIFTILGDSLAHGKGYLLQSHPHPYPYFTFPPLLAWLLATIQQGVRLISPEISSFQLQWIYKFVIHLMLTVGVGLFGLWARHISQGKAITDAPKPWLLWGSIFAVALQPLFYKYSADVLSDVSVLGVLS